MDAGEQPSICSPASIVSTLRYKPGWTFKIAGPNGSKLCVFATTPDSNNPARDRCTQHQFDLPGPLPLRDFMLWIDGCLDLIDRHERWEFLRIDDFAPFYPNHQDEGSPYELVERWEHP